MRTLRGWVLRLAEPFRRRQRDRELALELESHLELHVADNLRRGMTPEEARRQAVLTLGGVEQTKEAVRDRRGVPWLETLGQDFRFGTRMLLKHRGFTLVALVVLTCGIGASIATFSVVNRVLLRAFPYRAPEQLVMLWERTAQEELPTSYLNFIDWRSQNRVFESMAAYRGDDVVIASEAGPSTGGAERARALVVSAEFLATLGVRPALGRDFHADDDRVGAAPVAILSHALWWTRFGGDRGLVGRTVRLDGASVEVIGVLPAGFEFPTHGDLLVPLATIHDRLRFRGHDTGILAVARLRPGVTVERAGAEMEALMAELVRSYPEALAGRRIAHTPLDGAALGDLPRTLWILMGAVGFLLLIACTNVASLLMARAAARTREVTIRSAMGATRGRVIRQFLTESLTLSLLGGALGLVLARFLTRALMVFGPGNIPRLDDLPLDGRTLAFTLAVSIATGLVYGLLPAFQISRVDLSSSLKEAERGSSRRQAFGTALVVAEVALALVLLIGGGLMIQTFWRLHREDPGFRPRGLLAMQAIFSTTSRPEDGPRVRAFLATLQERLRAVPGVRDVAFADGLPYIGTNQVPLRVEGVTPLAGASPIALMYVTSSNYFEVMGLERVRGRVFDRSDPRGGGPVAVIDEVLASKYFAGQDPIGRRMALDTESAGPSFEIVGVVRHVKDQGFDGRVEAQPQFYTSLDQVADIQFADRAEQLHLVVRAGTDPAAAAPAVRGALSELDPNLPVFGVTTIEDLIGGTMAAQRFSVLLLTVFGLVALVLAVVGLYATMAYNVSQRRHEIGIRMALGARSTEVFGMVVRRSLAITATGLVIGIVAALALTRLLSNLLYGVRAGDPITFAGVAALFTLVAVIATLVPARRAASIDPMTALRSE